MGVIALFNHMDQVPSLFQNVTASKGVEQLAFKDIKSSDSSDGSDRNKGYQKSHSMTTDTWGSATSSYAFVAINKLH